MTDILQWRCLSDRSKTFVSWRFCSNHLPSLAGINYSVLCFVFVQLLRPIYQERTLGYTALAWWQTTAETRLQTCIVQSCAFTNVNYSEHVKTRCNTACGADHSVVEYLPSADSSQLFESLVHFHRHFVHTATTTFSSSSSSSSPCYDVSVHFSEMTVSQAINRTTAE